MMASMLRLLRHPNPYLRSKAVKMVGRGSKSPKWVRQRLNEADPRVRANAIEALWSVDTDEARILLQFAMADVNNRVAANALLGLYYLGECAVLGELVKMAGNESAPFRSSAAWAMAETGDFRFTDVLRGMLNDPDLTVRRHVFAALGRIKRSTSQSLSGKTWQAGAKLAGGNVSGTRRVLISVVADNTRQAPTVPPLGFILSEGASFVTSYSVIERPAAEAMSLVFVIPRSRDAAPGMYEALESCLKWKRTSDLWSILPYLETGDGEPPAVQEPDPPVFASNPESLGRILAEPARRIGCTDLWTTAWRASKTDSGAARGKRHVIVLSRVQETRIAGQDLIANVQSGRASIQAIASGPNDRLEEFCRTVHAPFQRCTNEDVSEEIRQTYLGLLARYEVSYSPAAADAASLTVRVQAPGGWGETVVMYPARET
jgi:hypothetical protein